MGGERYRYTIVVCPKCGTPKIADLASKTTRCPSCGRVLTLKKMRHHGGGNSPQSLIPLIAELNRRRGNIHTLFREERVNIVEIEEYEERKEVAETGEKGKKEEEEKVAVTVGKRERVEVTETEEGEGIREFTETETEELRAEVPEVGEMEEDALEENSRARQSGGDRISRLRRRLEDSGEFTVMDFTRIFFELGGKRERAADVLRSLMESGEVYSPKRGVFRFIGGSGD